ncbi:MAG: hypothetical protein ABJN26_18980 [Stappiaceae bacterium]
MELEQAQQIIRVLPKQRTLFDYYQDRYAIVLLEQKTKQPAPITFLKKTRFGKLLDKSAVKQIIAHKGDGILSREDLAYAERKDAFQSVLTLGLWSGRRRGRDWAQTSRQGTNLVLQMNFDREHDRAYERLVGSIDESPFCELAHPICTKGRTTMAWARLDIDWNSGEALVEEVQNDWVRGALSAYKDAKRLSAAEGGEKRNFHFWGYHLGRAPSYIEYVEKYLLPRAKYWSEAMLTATIWFLREELNIPVIWYHTPETGKLVKNIKYNGPPVSIYSRLPKQFCFALTDETPPFVIEAARKKVRQRLRTGKDQFWRLDLH